MSRKFIASVLAAVFIAGMFGSYAGAMELLDHVALHQNDNYRKNLQLIFDKVLNGEFDGVYYGEALEFAKLLLKTNGFNERDAEKVFKGVSNENVKAKLIENFSKDKLVEFIAYLTDFCVSSLKYDSFIYFMRCEDLKTIVNYVNDRTTEEIDNILANFLQSPLGNRKNKFSKAMVIVPIV